jgi:hypothetical protein
VEDVEDVEDVGIIDIEKVGDKHNIDKIIKAEIINDIKKNTSLEKQNKSNELNEITLEISDNKSEIFKLKKPNDVYIEIYKKTLKKAKEAKNTAIKAYLEAKKIKQEYILDELDSSDADDLEEFSE